MPITTSSLSCHQTGSEEVPKADYEPKLPVIASSLIVLGEEFSRLVSKRHVKNLLG